MLYSAFLTLVFAMAVLLGAAEIKKTGFEEITVRRINVIEPDGTLRMVISSKANFPGIIIKGKETPHPDRHTGGILFFNDEGTENGGLTWGGSKTADGQPVSSGHLSFDQYNQDQDLTIDFGQQGDKRSEAITFIDRPDYSIEELISLVKKTKDSPDAEKKSELAKFQQTHPSPKQRAYFGRSDDRSVSLKLKDAEGRDRIVIQVTADGAPVLKFLDASGTVISQLPAKP
jgi:hypothetical protein